MSGEKVNKTDHFIDSYNSRDAVKFGMEFYKMPSYLEMEKRYSNESSEFGLM